MNLTPEFMHKRSMIQLPPPNSVEFEFEGTTLVLKGEAPHSWVQKAQLLGPLLPGVTHIETGQLDDTDVKQFETLKDKLESKTIAFGVGESSISQNQRSALKDISQTIQALDQTAIVLGISPRIHIQGYTSPDGGKELNENLSVRRAKAVLNELAKGQYQASRGMAEGMGPEALLALSSSDKAVSQGRHVAFRVVLAQSNLIKSHR